MRGKAQEHRRSLDRAHLPRSLPFARRLSPIMIACASYSPQCWNPVRTVCILLSSTPRLTCCAIQSNVRLDWPTSTTAPPIWKLLPELLQVTIGGKTSGSKYLTVNFCHIPDASPLRRVPSAEHSKQDLVPCSIHKHRQSLQPNHDLESTRNLPRQPNLKELPAWR